MKSNLPIEDSEMTSNTEFRASVWRGGTYGLRMGLTQITTPYPS